MAATLFAACLQQLGLSQEAAAELLAIKLQRIKDMGSGRARVPDGIWGELRAYDVRIEERVDAMIDALNRSTTAAAGDPPQVLDAVVDDLLGLAALARFALATDLPIGEVQVGIV